MKRPALQNKEVVVLRMAFRARKVFGTFEKQAPDVKCANVFQHRRFLLYIVLDSKPFTKNRTFYNKTR